MTLHGLAVSVMARAHLESAREAYDRRAAVVAGITDDLARAARGDVGWDRRPSYRGAPAPGRALALRERLGAEAPLLAAERAGFDAGLRGVWTECPPLEIAHRVELIIARALADETIARGSMDDASVAAELAALSARVLAIWAPGVDLRALATRLYDASERDDVLARAPGAPHEHDTLGWSPVDGDELYALAARVIETSMASLGRRFAPELDEEAAYAVEVAVRAHPAIAIHVAARTACGVLACWTSPGEPTIHRVAGDLVWQSAAYVRALFLASLVELRRAVATAFPGFPELAGHRSETATRALRAATLGQGVYRVPAPPSEEPATAARPPTEEEELFAELERSGLRGTLARALPHATLVATIDALRAATETGGSVLDRVGAQSAGSAGPDGEQERRRLHLVGLHSVGRDGTEQVRRAGASRPALGLHDLVVQVHAAIAATSAPGGQASGVAPALAAFDAALAHFTRHYGTSGAHADLVRDVQAAFVAAVAPPPPDAPRLSRPQVVALYASALRATPFAALAARVEESRRERERATLAKSLADSRITTWDRLDVFGESDAERTSRVGGEQLREATRAMVADHAQMVALFADTLALHPPTDAYHALLRARDRFAAAHVFGSSSHATTDTAAARCEAAAALTAWTRGVLRVFGPMPSASELLVRFVARDL